MSRIGKLPVVLTAKVKATVVNNTVVIEGPRGRLEHTFSPNHVKIRLEGNAVKVEPAGGSRLCHAMHGTARSIIAGMVVGVEKGYEKKLEVSGVGFKAEVKGKALQLELGFSHEILLPIPAGITIKVENGTMITVSGSDKQVVGQIAASIYQFYPVEPYKAKGVHVVGQHIRRKEGKKAG
ncbi:MAG TPA: 50S ribosomal protein L6 [Opitutales bacterium]|nr:50S ribosomal protein L6 [Opitutales bacterium]